MDTTLIIMGALVVTFVVLNIYAKAKMKNAPAVTDHKNILIFTEKNFPLGH